ncbi:MAG: PhnD/SsuA/transferrin family substrate-binding protein [Deltaproteobacteria bacterium]|nr:PhnD/SsuA/transferrin family substrate-binding protein [Deltaproteobacteria bacterium]
MAAEVRFESRTLQWNDGESLLDCLERAGANIPSSCRSGACQSCLVKAVDGAPPPGSQDGLKPTWRAQKLFLSCVCKTPSALSVSKIDASAVSVPATCVEKERLTKDILRVVLKTEAPFEFRAGQFATITAGGHTRSYSIASLPQEGSIELHVRRVEGGRMSAFLFDTLAVGDRLTLRGPSGDCFYVDGKREQALVLVATGTGLAPLWGIARDAVARGHTGPISIFHGGKRAADLYLDAALTRLAAQHPNVHYLGCLSDADAPLAAHHRAGRVDKVLTAELATLHGHRAFICGSPPMVKDLKQHVYRAGVDKDEIFADAFISAPPPAAPPAAPPIAPKKRTTLRILAPDPTPAAKHSIMQRVRFAVQALALTGLLVQGVLYYNTTFRPLGNLLPFMAYDSVGHMMVSSALIAWAALFLLAMLFGRFMCGWLCPLGFMQDSGEKLLKAVGVQLRRPLSQPRIVRFALAALVVGHFAVMPLLAAPVKLWQVDLHFREPWLLGFPFRAGLFALDLLLVFVVIGIVLPLFFGPRPYCKMVCETGYLLDRASSFAFGRIRRNHGFDQDTCLSCGKCTATCPQGINVHEEVHLFDRVVNTSCITCLQCVNICPNDTIIYSLRKRVADTGKVAGYLASLHVRAEDVPRHVLTGAGVVVGAYVGFRVLPPSYSHSYLLLASLGGLTGYLAWRALSQVWTATAPALSTVEREAKERVLPLSPQERLALTKEKKPSRVAPILGLLLAYGLVVAASVLIVSQMSPRITKVADIDRTKADPSWRAQHGVFYFGVPPTLADHDTHRTYGSMHEWLSQSLAAEAYVMSAESYGQLAGALEQGHIDAAILPAGTAAAVLGRQASGAPKPEAERITPIAQVEIYGRTTYSGALVTHADGPREVDAVRGLRLAVTSFDSVSGCLAPMALLREHGVTAMDLGEVLFAGSHGKALALLAAVRVDVAATFDGALERFRTKNPTIDLVTIATYDGLLTDIVLVRGGLDAVRRRALEATLFRLPDDPSDEAARARSDLAAGSVTAFAPWSAERFKGFKRLYEDE